MRAFLVPTQTPPLFLLCVQITYYPAHELSTGLVRRMCFQTA